MDTFNCLKDRKMTRAEENDSYLETYFTCDTNTKSSKYFKKAISTSIGRKRAAWSKLKPWRSSVATKTWSQSVIKKIGRVLVAPWVKNSGNSCRTWGLAWVGEMRVINTTKVVAYKATKEKTTKTRSPLSGVHLGNQKYFRYDAEYYDGDALKTFRRA